MIFLYQALFRLTLFFGRMSSYNFLRAFFKPLGRNHSIVARAWIFLMLYSLQASGRVNSPSQRKIFSFIDKYGNWEGDRSPAESFRAPRKC